MQFVHYYTYQMSVTLWFITFDKYVDTECSQVDIILEELRNSLASIPLPPSCTKTWTERKEQVEQSWGNHRCQIFENVVSSMALPSEAVCICNYYSFIPIVSYTECTITVALCLCACVYYRDAPNIDVISISNSG